MAYGFSLYERAVPTHSLEKSRNDPDGVGTLRAAGADHHSLARTTPRGSRRTACTAVTGKIHSPRAADSRAPSTTPMLHTSKLQRWTCTAGAMWCNTLVEEQHRGGSARTRAAPAHSRAHPHPPTTDRSRRSQVHKKAHHLAPHEHQLLRQHDQREEVCALTRARPPAKASLRAAPPHLASPRLASLRLTPPRHTPPPRAAPP